MSEVLNGILNGKWGTCVTSERVSLLHFLEKLPPKKTYDHAFSTAQSNGKNYHQLLCQI